MSDDGEWIEGAILDDWRARDEAKDARIEALEAALAKADELADECKRMSPAIWDAFNNRGAGNRHGIATANAFDRKLTAYRQARDATR